jgi:hypothetical protein
MAPTRRVPTAAARRRLLPLAAATALPLLGAGAALGAGPVNGSVAGPVTAISGQTFRLTTPLSPTGGSTVRVVAETAITEQQKGSLADVKKGVCANALGTKAKNGAIAATRVMLSQPLGGACGARFRVGGGPGGPPGGRPPGGGTYRSPRTGTPPVGFDGLGFANGTVTSVKGSTVTLHDRTGTHAVTVSTKTAFSKTVRVAFSAIKVKACAFVRGTSADKGVTVKAQAISLSQPTGTGANACATPRIRRR